MSEKKRRLPHCWLCKKEGSCVDGSMKLVWVEEGHGIYLCPEHYENKEEIVRQYLAEREKWKK